MKILLKPNVRLDGVAPQMAIALQVVASFYNELGARVCVITSANDSVHGTNSLHHREGRCRAFDFRTNDLYALLPLRDKAQRAKELEQFRLSISQALPEFDVLLEDVNEKNEHLHVEWDPKGRSARI